MVVNMADYEVLRLAFGVAVAVAFFLFFALSMLYVEWNRRRTFIHKQNLTDKYEAWNNERRLLE